MQFFHLPILFPILALINSEYAKIEPRQSKVWSPAWGIPMEEHLVCIHAPQPGHRNHPGLVKKQMRYATEVRTGLIWTTTDWLGLSRLATTENDLVSLRYLVLNRIILDFIYPR